MDNNIRFRRNVYIIVFCILIFGVISQVTRSDLILKYVSNGNQLTEEKRGVLQNNYTNINMLVSDDKVDDKHCIVYDSSDEVSVMNYANFQEVYRYIKQPYSLQDAALDTVSYEGCKAVVIISGLEALNDSYIELEHYIENGGYVFAAMLDQVGPVFTQLYRKLGIINYSDFTPNLGVELTSSIILGQRGDMQIDEYFYNDSLLVELDQNSEILAKGTVSPISWRFEYGDGAIVVYNGNNLYTKTNRGLIVGALGMLLPDYIYPIFNAKLFYIDDFPAPISTASDPRITAEYNRNISSFFKDIWWPDMIRLAKNYHLKYTAVAIEDYNNDVIAPLPSYRQDDLANLISYGREVLKTGGEIGIHGYNHQPLQFDESIAKEYDYVVWNSYEDMEASIQEVVAYLKKGFPSYDTVSYVPPSNILSQEGRRALVNNWESLFTISSLYEEDSTGHSYVQEFEIADDGIIEMPRITSGYAENSEMVWLEANVMTTHGFISHFIHPDDIFDDYRSGGKGWGELYRDFQYMLKRMDDTYSWLKAQTSTEAAVQVATVLNSQITRQQTESKIDVKIDNYYLPQYFILRTDKKIGKLTNCHVKLIEDNTYLVETTDEHFNIELSR